MNRRVHSILFLLALFPAWSGAQTIIDTMYFDGDWDQCNEPEASYYRIISVPDTGDFLFHVTDHYLSGQVQMTGTYRSIEPDYKTGEFVYYYSNGQTQARSEYKNNALDGPSEEWYKDGTKKSSFYFIDGKLDGNIRTWNEKGIPELNAQYNMGKIHGYFISYYPDGTMTRKDLYENDKLVEGKCFDRTGNQIAYFPYKIDPSFSGGTKALYKYIRKEMKYPRKAYKKGIEGIVLVGFTVNEQGQCIDPNIIIGDREEFNEEALRLVSTFPRWNPGKIDDQPAPIKVQLPIEFHLE